MAISNTLIADRKVVWDNPPRPQRVGLVLGGGAARGIAHVGVLQALEENGIYPAVIAGTSVGALVGGLYAAGVSSMRLATIVRDLKWLDLVSVRLPAINWSDPARTIPMGMVDLDKLMEWIDQVVGSPVDIQQLNLPYAAVATDLLSGEIVVMNEGPLAEAIRASCSVPGVFTPYHRNGRLLVDGVVVNNLPVSVAQDLGADYVIAVDLLPLLGDCASRAAQCCRTVDDGIVHACACDPDRAGTGGYLDRAGDHARQPGGSQRRRGAVGSGEARG